MPTGIYIRTKYHRNKLKVPHKGSGVYKRTEIMRKHISESKRGNKNSNWSGNKVEYNGLHKWINRNFGYAKECHFCKKQGEKTKFGRWNISWANISGEYKRDISDFIGLCVKCHLGWDSLKRRGSI